MPTISGPITASLAYNCPSCIGASPTAAQGGPFGESQSQFIDVKTWSQELRFTSHKVGGFSWIAGAYFVHTERFISTGNLADRGEGVPAVYYDPIVDPTNPYATNTNQTFLADSQNNNAWAVFADATYEFTPQWELDAAIRYDADHRENTTDTPTHFLPTTTAYTGEVRKATFSATQPKATLRYKPDDDLDFLRRLEPRVPQRRIQPDRCRRGRARQRGARRQRSVPGRDRRHLRSGVQEPVARPPAERRLALSIYTQSTNGYFFVYIAATSTQNLGNLDATYKGGELSLTARPTDRLDPVRQLRLHRQPHHRDGRIPPSSATRRRSSSQGHRQCRLPVRQPFGDGLNGMVRLDYQDDRPHLVGAVQHHLARSGQSWSICAPGSRPRSGR